MDVQILRKQFGYTSIDLKGSDKSYIHGNHEHIEVDMSPLRYGFNRNESLALKHSNI